MRRIERVAVTSRHFESWHKWVCTPFAVWRRACYSQWRSATQSAATCSWWFLARGFFYSEDGGDKFLRNVGSHKIYTAPHPRRRHSSYSPLWNPQILHSMCTLFPNFTDCPFLLSLNFHNSSEFPLTTPQEYHYLFLKQRRATNWFSELQSRSKTVTDYSHI
jgi:hypothetical protein